MSTVKGELWCLICGELFPEHPILAVCRYCWDNRIDHSEDVTQYFKAGVR